MEERGKHFEILERQSRSELLTSFEPDDKILEQFARLAQNSVRPLVCEQHGKVGICRKNFARRKFENSSREVDYSDLLSPR